MVIDFYEKIEKWSQKVPQKSLQTQSVTAAPLRNRRVKVCGLVVGPALGTGNAGAENGLKIHENGINMGSQIVQNQ